MALVGGSAATTMFESDAAVDNEATRLLRKSARDSSVRYDDDANNLQDHGPRQKKSHASASVSQTILTMSKTCMGTGCLVLPVAAKEGGLILHIFGLLAIGSWNVLMVQLLCQCQDMTETADGRQSDDYETNAIMVSVSSPTNSKRNFSGSIIGPHERRQPPPEGTSTLAKLAWYSPLGRHGADALDIMMVIYLIGVVVTYWNAMRSFLSDIPLTTGAGAADSFLLVLIVAPLSVVPHTGYLARASAMGLSVLFFTFAVITASAFFTNEADDDMNHWKVLTGDTEEAGNHTSSHLLHSSVLQQTDNDLHHQYDWFFPQEGLAGASRWFGCVVFGFGIIPLTFNFRDAMSEPQRMVFPATVVAMAVVSGSYIVLGWGLWWLYPDIDGDVLHELPKTGWLPVVTRLAMIMVVLVTAPLLVVPCGELVEGKVSKRSAISSQEGSTTDSIIPREKRQIQIVVRWSICLVCASISTFVPGFVDVLSFVGCCCVAVVGFCIPPLLHLLLSQTHKQQDMSLLEDDWLVRVSKTGSADLALFLLGLLATFVSTVFTLRQMMDN